MFTTVRSLRSLFGLCVRLTRIGSGDLGGREQPRPSTPSRGDALLSRGSAPAQPVGSPDPVPPVPARSADFRRRRPHVPLRRRRRRARRHARFIAVAPGKVSDGSPADLSQHGGVVVVQADGRNFGYWHVGFEGAHVLIGPAPSKDAGSERFAQPTKPSARSWRHAAHASGRLRGIVWSLRRSVTPRNSRSAPTSWPCCAGWRIAAEGLTR